MVAAIALVSPAFGASIVIDGTHGKKVYIGNFQPEISFTSQLLRGSPTTFDITLDGMTWADGRWCSNQPPWAIPPDCIYPIDPIHWSDTFIADTEWPLSQEFLVPFFGEAVEGYLTFGPTDGGRVLITVNGRALPEPASWAMMLGGLGAIGGAMRARRKVAVRFG
jgi:hypothetical protein